MEKKNIIVNKLKIVLMFHRLKMEKRRMKLGRGANGRCFKIKSVSLELLKFLFFKTSCNV